MIADGRIVAQLRRWRIWLPIRQGASRVLALGGVTLLASLLYPASARASISVDQTVSVDGVGPVTTATFGTAPGDVLVAFAASDGPASGGQTLTVGGGRIAWNLIRRANAQLGTAETWTATASTALANVTVTSTQSIGGYHQSLTVVAFGGAAGVGSSASASGANGAPSTLLTTTQPGSVVFAVGNDWDNAIARTVAAGQSILHQDLDTSVHDTYWVQRVTAPIATAGTLVAVADMAPTTDRWNLVAIEMVSAQASGTQAGAIVDQVVSVDGSGTVNTRAFSTALPGALIVAFVASDGPSSGGQQVTVGGGGLSWSLVRRANAQLGTSEIWTATASTLLSNATVRSTQRVGGFRQSLTVVVFTGAAGVGASVGASALNGAPSVTLTTSRAQSLVFGVGNDWDHAIPRMIALDQILIHQDVDTSSHDTYWVQASTSVVGAAGTPVQIADTAPTSDQWNFAAVEILAAATPTPVPTGSAIAPLVFVDGSGTVTTPSFTTAGANQALVAFVASDGPPTQAQSVTVSGGDLLWTLVRRANNQAGTAEIWKATATTALSNVTIQSIPAFGGYHQSLTLVLFKGGAVGSSAAASGAQSAPTVSLTTTAAASSIYGVGNDWDHAIARTVGANQLIAHQWAEAVSGDTFWVQARTAPIVSAGTAAQITDTAPINDRWNLAAIEILPAPASVAPTANPGGPYIGTVGQAVGFNGAASTAPSGRTITSFAWNFGDNTTGTGATPTHTFVSPGTFQISLTVTDSSGASNTASTTATIAGRPTANPGGPYQGTVNQPVSFNGTGSTAPVGRTITSYAWNFGDNSTGTGATPTHTYTAVGTFEISLTVTDSLGATNTASTTATVAARPTANAGGPYVGTVNQPLTFNGTSSTASAGRTIASYAWNFGDNSVGTGATPTHTYASVGTFQVSLTITDTSGATDTASTRATVLARPTASAGGPYSSTVNQSVTFDGTRSTAAAGQTIASYAWNFGDNSSGTGATPTHTYTTAGTFQISLTVTDSIGGTDSATTTATITAAKITSITGFTPASGPIGTLVDVTLTDFTPTPGSPLQVTLARAGGGSIPAPVSSASVDALSFVVPAGAATGKITVSSAGQTTVSDRAFTVTTSSTFTINVGPSTANLIQGQEVTYAITLNSSSGFKGLATLAVNGVPNGVTAAFKPTAITGGQTSVLTLSAPATQAASTSTLSVTASATIDGQDVSQSATASLRITGVSTSFVGRTVVDDAQQMPIAGVSIRFMGKDDKGNATGCSAQTTSDAGGNFALTDLSASCIGPQLISYDGLTATSPEGKFAGVNLSYTLVAGKVTASPVLIHLPRIDNAETIDIKQGAPTNQVFTFDSLPSVRVNVPAGTMFTLDDGSRPDPFPMVAVEVPVDRLPDKMATSGLVMPFIVAFQPANAHSSQPVAVDYPNSLNLPPGATATLMTLDPTRGYMVPYGTGTVTSDGSRIFPDLDPAHPGMRYGITNFDWHGPASPPNPTNPSPDGPCGPTSGKPVDLSSGVEVITVTDIGVQCERGSLEITRTYRTLSTALGPFGIGTNHNYGYRLNTNSPQTSGAINLIMPDGNQILFSRQSGGTLTNNTIPSMRGAVMTTASNGTTSLRWKDGIVFQFVPSTFQLGAVLTSITNSNGNVIALTRDPERPARITEVTDAVSRKLTLTYDGADRITTIRDPIGRTIHYTYNGQGTLETVTDAANGITRYEYDSQNRVTRVTDANGQVQAQNSYDVNGRVIRQVAADGGATTLEYTLLNSAVPTSPVLLTKVTDPLGHETSYRFSPEGFVVSVTDALGGVRVFERESGSNLLLALKGTGTCPVCGATAAGDQAFTYDAFGNRTSVTDALGNTTRFTYETVFNKVASITDPMGHTTSFGYDDRGNLTTITDASGRETTSTPDAFGSVAQMTDAAGKRTAFSYDAFGNLVSSTDALGHMTRLTYDGASRKTVTADGLDRATSITYDAMNRLESFTDGNGDRASFSYVAVGNLIKLVDAKGHQTKFTYDAKSHLITKTKPLGEVDTRSYDLNGNLVSFADRRGQQSVFTYDKLNRLITETYEDSTVSRSYDAAGRLVNVVDSEAGTFFFSYDAAGRLVESMSPVGRVQFVRDPQGRVLKRQVVGLPAVTYSYDPVGNLLSAESSRGSIVQTFDSRNKVVSQTRSNGVVSAFTYDAVGRVLSINTSLGNSKLDAHTYTYDAVGNRVQHDSDFGQPLVTAPASSEVDENDRLLRRGAITYTYDANGNRLSETGPFGTIRYMWDSRDRLKTITSPSGTVTRFTYDFNGLMISQNVIGDGINTSQTYVLDDISNVVAQGDSRGVLTATLSGDSIDQHWAVSDSAGNIRFGVTDAINSAVAVTGDDGTVVARSFYEPFGETRDSGAAQYPFKFTGRVSVGGGLYYYRARHYDAAAGRFLNEDPLGIAGGGPNSYTYVNGDPISRTDATGECPWCVAALIGGVTDLFVQLAFNGFNLNCVNWWEVGASAAISGATVGLGQVLTKAGYIGKFSTQFGGPARPTYRFFKAKDILRIEAHPPGAAYPNWFSYPHWHIDAFDGALKGFHLPLVEPAVGAAAAARNAGKGDCGCEK